MDISQNLGAAFFRHSAFIAAMEIVVHCRGMMSAATSGSPRLAMWTLIMIAGDRSAGPCGRGHARVAWRGWPWATNPNCVVAGPPGVCRCRRRYSGMAVVARPRLGRWSG